MGADGARPPGRQRLVFRAGWGLVAAGLLLVVASFLAALTVLGYWLMVGGLAMGIPGVVLVLTSGRGGFGAVLLLVGMVVLAASLLADGIRVLGAARW
ncbi:MAG: hypothetical protein IT304_03435 [Dehalococcoidia bacterium]|nr:hypothetical protein [Dehalococcoidia bacterium]